MQGSVLAFMRLSHWLELVAKAESAHFFASSLNGSLRAKSIVFLAQLLLTFTNGRSKSMCFSVKGWSVPRESVLNVSLSVVRCHDAYDLVTA
jgi:hypothetical protein